MVAADHLQVPRQHGLFHHHGIDLGDGTVAHYLEGREILRSTLEEFCRGEVFSVITHNNASTTGITLRRAMSRIGEQNYNLLFNNCEHFANWCKTGMHRSDQIEDCLKTGRFSAMLIGKLFPKTFLRALALLINQGLVDEASKQKAKELLRRLKQIRLILLNKLDSTLEQLDDWIQTSPNNIEKHQLHSTTRNLYLRGQTIADDLTAIEALEIRISDLLNEKK